MQGQGDSKALHTRPLADSPLRRLCSAVRIASATAAVSGVSAPGLDVGPPALAVNAGERIHCSVCAAVARSRAADASGVDAAAAAVAAAAAAALAARLGDIIPVPSPSISAPDAAAAALAARVGEKKFEQAGGPWARAGVPWKVAPCSSGQVRLRCRSSALMKRATIAC